MQHLAESLRNHIRLRGIRERHRDREGKTRDDGDKRGEKRGQHIEPEYQTKAAVEARRALRQRTGNQNKDEHRRDRLERADKQIAEFLDPDSLRKQQRQNDAEQKSDENAENQAGVIVPVCKRTKELTETIHDVICPRSCRGTSSLFGIHAARYCLRIADNCPRSTCFIISRNCHLARICLLKRNDCAVYAGGS